VRKSCHVRL